MKTLGELARLLGGRLTGIGEIPIADVKTTLRAGAQDLTFVNGDQHMALFLNGKAPAAIVGSATNVGSLYVQTGKSFITSDSVEEAFVKALCLLRPPRTQVQVGVSERAIIANSAEIATDVDIYPGAFIGENVRVGRGTVIYPHVTILNDVRIGDDSILFPNVVVYENTVIGNRCLIHGGAVIGGYGFGYRSGKTHELGHQLGNVVIGDDVEIGSNTTIDRGTFDSTTIGDGSKLDDLVMIGHNCHIGKHNLFCSQVGIAGSTVTGDYVVMAGQVGVGDHLRIGDKVTIAAQSGVMRDLEMEQVYLGSPAVPIRRQMQIHAVINKLPEMRSQLQRLQRMIDVLSESLDSKSNAA